MMHRRSLILGSPALLVTPIAPAVAEESKGDLLQRFLDTASPNDLILHHLTGLTLAMHAQYGGLWQGIHCGKAQFAMANLWDSGGDGVFIKPNGK